MKKPSWSRCDPLLLAVAGCTLVAAPLSAQSLWKESSSQSMVADKRARAVGDILTIQVQESNSVTKDNSTSTAKKSGVDASIASFLFGPGASGLLTKGGQFPSLKLEGKSDFTGGGKINNTENMNTRIAVRVVDVLPNGNLVLEGNRQTSFAGETQDAILRGVVRGEDVAANNVVFSYNVANATIRFVSKGAITDSQKKGWFTRVWDKVTPF